MKTLQKKLMFSLPILALSVTPVLSAPVLPSPVFMEPVDLRLAQSADSSMLDPTTQTTTITLSEVTQQGSMLKIRGEWTTAWGAQTFVSLAQVQGDSRLVDFELDLAEMDHGPCGDFHRETALLRIRRAPNQQVRVIRAVLKVEHTSERCSVPMWETQVVLTPANDLVCAQALSDFTGFAIYTRDAETGTALTGFSSTTDYGVWGQDLSASLILENASGRVYHTRPCDICADLLKCDRNTGDVVSVYSGHSASCEDISDQDRSSATFLNCK